MNVEIGIEAREELKSLPPAELRAMARAFEKLQVDGIRLAYPHSSHVQGTGLRELRPKAGRSPWRALYARIGDAIVVIAIAPEALHDVRGFKRAVMQAQERFGRLIEERG